MHPDFDQNMRYLIENSHTFLLLKARADSSSAKRSSSSSSGIY